MKRLPILVAALLFAMPPAAQATVTNGQLAVVWNGEQLETLNPDGSNARMLWHVPREGEGIGQLAWSPDGNQIAFVYGDATENNRIAATDLRTGVTRMVSDHDPANAEGALRDESPGWLSDGRIAWRRIPRGTSGGGSLMAAQPDGSDVQTLPLALQGDVIGAAWSRAGRVLLSENNVTASDPDGGNAISYPLGSLPLQFAWSPDESAVAYGYGSQLAAVDLDSGTRVLLTPYQDRASDDDPAWAPDGNALAYTHSAPDIVAGQAIGTSIELRTLDLTTGEITTVIKGSYAAAWQPCVAGVTASCTSPPPTSTCVPPGTKVIGAPVPVCPTSLTLPPATPTLTPALARPPVAPAAPRLVLSSAARIDRHGRALLKGRCTAACSVALRITVELRGGRVLKGKLVRATTSTPLAAVSLRLTAPRIPKHARVAAMHIAGTVSGRVLVTGTVSSRAFSLKLKR